jgi:hypothetical protein
LSHWAVAYNCQSKIRLSVDNHANRCEQRPLVFDLIQSGHVDCGKGQRPTGSINKWEFTQVDSIVNQPHFSTAHSLDGLRHECGVGGYRDNGITEKRRDAIQKHLFAIVRIVPSVLGIDDRGDAQYGGPDRPQQVGIRIVRVHHIRTQPPESADEPKNRRTESTAIAVQRDDRNSERLNVVCECPPVVDAHNGCSKSRPACPVCEINDNPFQPADAESSDDVDDMNRTVGATSSGLLKAASINGRQLWRERHDILQGP